MKRDAQFAIQILGSIACFWWIFRIVSPELLIESLTRASVLLVGLLAIIMIPAVLARAWRWHYLLSRRNIPVSLTSITKATFIGMALNLILPASAGDLLRSYYSWQEHGHKEEMIATTLSDKVVALLSLFVLGALGGLAYGDKTLVFIASSLILPTSAILFIPMRWIWKMLARGTNRLLRRDLDVDLLLQSFHVTVPTFCGAMIISMIGWMITNLMYYLALWAVGADVGLGYTFAIAPLINILRMLPLSISGLGSADALMVHLLENVGIAKHVALAASMLVNLTLLLLPGAIGVLFMLIHGRNNLRRSQLVHP